MAHRGGAKHMPNEGIENSLVAFASAIQLGYRYLETDVHCSADGILYAFHDDTLERLTGNPAAISTLDSAVIDRARLGGREPIPRMQDLFEAFPTAYFNIDVKADAAVAATAGLIAQMGVTGRVCVASFSHSRLAQIRAALPFMATSFSPKEVARLKLGRGRLSAFGVARGGVCVQVPRQHGRIRVVTANFVRRAHGLGLPVHVWTIDDADEMHALLDLGVDGIVSDRIDVLKTVLVRRGQWQELP